MTMALLVLQLLILPVSLAPAVENGDREFSGIRYAAAETFYHAALASGSDSSEALWRLARLYVCMADVSTGDRKLGLYRQAESFADRCLMADSMSSEGHTWRAAALGNIAMFEGSKMKVKLCHAIKKELDESIRLNPDDDIAWSILGSFYMALGSVSWLERRLAAIFLGSLPDGGYEDAELALLKAVDLSPQIIRHHAELGDLYMRQNRNREALIEFRQVMSLPVRLANDERAQSDAARLIQELNQD
ncbi:MAG: hypothetical protein H6Q30_2245 [Bacteroidetes bacterium]|nr:hypothetical protein [Bacteroidota bacterium]